MGSSFVSRRVSTVVSFIQNNLTTILLVVYSIFLVKKIIASSLVAAWFPGFLDNVIDILVLIVTFVVSAEKSYRNKNILLRLLLLCTVGIIIKLSSDNLSFLSLVLFLFAFRGESFEKICKLTLLVAGGSLLAIVILSQVGIVQDYIWLSGARGERHGLGFLYPSYLSLYFLNYALVCLYICRNMNWSRLIVVSATLLAVDYAIYAATDTRATFLLTAFSVLVFLLQKACFNKLRNTPRKILIVTSSFLYLPCAVASIGMTWLYDSAVEWEALLNSALSGRLNLIHNALLKYGVTLFGQHINMAASNGKLSLDGTFASLAPNVETNVVDNSYMSILILQGIVLFIVVIAAWGWLGIKCVRNQDVVISIILAVIAIHGLVDPQLIKIDYNTFLLLFTTHSGLVLSGGSQKSISPKWSDGVLRISDNA